MAMKVSISFKEDEKEMHDFLTGQLSPSIFIKQMIKNEMEKSIKSTSDENKKQNILNF